jgi:hypothetical protein
VIQPEETLAAGRAALDIVPVRHLRRSVVAAICDLLPLPPTLEK